MTAMRQSLDDPAVEAPAPRKRWRWIVVVAALAVTAAAGVGVASAASSTAPSVRFSKIQYNSPGTDDRSAASLNGEWVRITNMTTKAISLKGWTVRDAAGHQYTFGTYSLPAHANAYVHTGTGTDGRPDSQHRYWKSGNYIWNNTGDTATIRNSSGTTVHSCKWGNSGSVTYCGTVMPPPPTTRPTTAAIPTGTSDGPIIT
jgi:Lamin Tail Domain